MKERPCHTHPHPPERPPALPRFQDPTAAPRAVSPFPSNAAEVLVSSPHSPALPGHEPHQAGPCPGPTSAHPQGGAQ